MIKNICIYIFLLFAISTQAQTAGSGVASSIISKVNQILDLQKQNNDLDTKRQSELNALNSKLSSLRNKIAQLQEDWLEALNDLRNGYFCSRCGKPRKSFGSNAAFEQHLTEVQGYRVPATEKQIKDAKKEYDDKIAAAQLEYDQLNQTGGNYKLNMDRYENQKTLNLDKIEELKEAIKLDQKKWNDVVRDDLIRQYTHLFEPVVREIWKKRRAEIAFEKLEKIINKMINEKDSVVRARINEYRDRNYKEKKTKEDEQFTAKLDLNALTNQWNLDKNRIDLKQGNINSDLYQSRNRVARESDQQRVTDLWSKIYQLQRDSFDTEKEMDDKKNIYTNKEKTLSDKIKRLDKEIEEIRLRMFDESKITTLVNTIYERKLDILRESKSDLRDLITQLEQNIRSVEGDAQLKRRMILTKHETEVYELYTYLNKISMSMYQEGITNANYKWSHFETCCGSLKRGQDFTYVCDEIGALWAQLGSPEGSVLNYNTSSPVSQTDLDILIGQIRK